jgi:hypothetical protein
MELILEIKREEERGNWIKIHNEDCSDFHGVWNIRRRIMRRGGHVARMKDNSIAHKILSQVMKELDPWKG